MKTKRQYVADLMVISILAAVVIWYMMDAYGASSKIANLLLIFPIGFISLFFLAGIAFQTIPKLIRNSKRKEESPIKEPKNNVEEGDIKKVIAAMVLLVFYVLLLSFVGFDVVTFLFVSSMLFIQGERRPFWLIVFPLIFSLVVSQFFSAMIPYPMPMALQTEWLSSLI